MANAGTAGRPSGGADAPAARWRRLLRGSWPTLPVGVLLPVAVVLLGAVLVGVAVHHRGEYIDLEVYRFGVSAWLAGEDPYGTLPPTSVGVTLPYIYPPFAALTMVPLTAVPWTVAWVGLLAASALGLAVTLYVTARALWPSAGRGLAMVVAVLPWAWALEPVLQTVGFGQINLLLMALVAADCLVKCPRWPRGVLIGLAAAIKLTPAAFVLFLLLRRDYRAAGVAAVTGVAATAVGFAVAPGASLAFWADPAGGVSGSPFFTNQTFQAVLVRAGIENAAGGAGALTAAWLVLSLALLALVAPLIRRAPAPEALAVTAAFALLVSPTSWSHHWVWVALALLVGVATARRRRSVGWTVGTALTAVVFVSAPHGIGLPRAGEVELTWTPLQQLWGSTYVWFTVLVLIALAVRHRRRSRSSSPGQVETGDGEVLRGR